MMPKRYRRTFLCHLSVAASVAGANVAGAAETFTYAPPGSLVNGSGSGRVDKRVFAPGMRFPLESGPAYANSQVWGHGGGSGPRNTSQCDKENFSYPWRDNYCETRTWSMPLCPSGNGHQGQDIRAATCEKGVHWAVAVADGTITNIGSYSVYLTASDGTRFDYLHMQDLLVKEGQKVRRGDRMGKVSNEFGGESTTVHLHFNIRQNVAGVGLVYVPTYLSLVESYETLLGLEPDAGPEAGPDAAGPAIPPAPPVGPPHDAAPVAPSDPMGPEAGAPDEEDGCAFAPARARSGVAFGAALTLAALAIVSRRRRR